ncbi:MAG: c-type cytochrome [Acidimicrobiia bacterium]
MRNLIVVEALMALAACAQAPLPSLGDPDLDAGRQTFNRVCATCHGPNGQGASAPTLENVLATFSDCAKQQRWIFLGSERWTEEVGPTYGDTDKEITAVMPSFEAVLSPVEIAQVAAFQRLQFGGATIEESLSGCGL